jgi:hypothetical protein
MSARDADTAGYQLARDPDEVPTPLAIAAADFCRRAGRPSSPEAVRLALARLDDSDDGALQALVDAEPEARPLGPEALVDLVRGLHPDEAAAREDSGYYLAMARAPRVPAPPRSATRRVVAPSKPSALQLREQQKAEVVLALEQAGGDLPRAAKSLGIELEQLQARLKRFSLLRQARTLARGPGVPEAIAPVVRPKGTRQARVRPLAAVPPPLPKRGAGRLPKGRMILGTAVARDPRELERAAGKDELGELLRNFRGNRLALLERLNQIFRSPKGPLTVEQLDALITRHGLRAEADQLERENLVFLFTQARGDLPAVAKKLKLKPGALKRELQERGLWAEAERIRDRFRRELFGRATSEQVQSLLTRQSYLKEIGALKALDQFVRQEVERQWVGARASGPSGRQAALAKRLNVDGDVAATLIVRYRLK